jgi:hypothetical protein
LGTAVSDRWDSGGEAGSADSSSGPVSGGCDTTFDIPYLPEYF